MLTERKPVASFVVEDGCEALHRYLRLFDRHVTLGRFIRRERPETVECPARRVLYALPGEEWRIDALLRHYDEQHGWTAESERIEGRLLGYAEWEIEAWLDHLRRTGILRGD